MKLTAAHHDAFCDLTVAAQNHCADIVGISHALYYYSDEFSRPRVSRMLSDLREALDALNENLSAAEVLFAPRVASTSEELLQQLRDSCELCDAETQQC